MDHRSKQFTMSRRQKPDRPVLRLPRVAVTYSGEVLEIEPDQSDRSTLAHLNMTRGSASSAIVKRNHAAAKRKHVIAVLEDDSAVRESLKFSLEIEGFEVHACASPDELLNRSMVFFDCLVIDYHLPGTNGLDVLDKLREEGNSAQAILLTGNPNPNMLRRASAAGVMVIEKSPGADLIEIIHGLIAAS
jgi:two-component system, LuxR family, response regulator FixJ